MLSAMTALKQERQTPNHTILILTSSDLSQLAKSIEESLSGHTGSRRNGESANRASNQCSQLQTIFYSPPQPRPDWILSQKPSHKFSYNESSHKSCREWPLLVDGSLTLLGSQIIYVMLYVPPVRLEVLGEGGSSRPEAGRRESMQALVVFHSASSKSCSVFLLINFDDAHCRELMSLFRAVTSTGSNLAIRKKTEVFWLLAIFLSRSTGETELIFDQINPLRG
jgi:hypothetical protein